MKGLKKVVFILMVMCLSMLTTGVYVKAEEPKVDRNAVMEVTYGAGSGDNIDYTFYGNGVLIISGTGVIKGERFRGG